MIVVVPLLLKISILLIKYNFLFKIIGGSLFIMVTKKFLNTEDILKANDLIEREIFVEPWNGSVKIREFSKAKQQELRKEATIGGELDQDKLEMLLFIYGVIEPAFNQTDYELLRGKSAKAIDIVLKELLKLSGLTDEEIKQAEQRFRA